MTTSRWLDARRKGIGSSDVAKLRHESRYGGDWSVWADKFLGWKLEVADEQATERGLVLEPALIQHFCRRFGAKARDIAQLWPDRAEWLEHEGERRCILWADDGTPIFCTGDAVVEMRGDLWALEIKTAGLHLSREDPCPKGWGSQLRHQVTVMKDVRGGFLHGLLGNLTIRSWQVDEGMPVSEMSRFAGWYRRHVSGGIEPQPTSADLPVLRTFEMLGGEILAGREHLDTVRSWTEYRDAGARLRQLLKVQDARKAEYEAKLRALIKEHRQLVIDGVGPVAERKNWGDGDRLMPIPFSIPKPEEADNAVREIT